MKMKYAGFSIIMFFIFILTSNAAQGCCSWHGGISHCGTNGYYICNDGTQSPSCTCSNYNLDDYYELTDTSKCYATYEDVKELKNNIENLESENKELENNLSNYKFLFWGVLITFIIYVYYQKHKNKIRRRS